MPGPTQQAKEAFGSRLREIRQDAGLTGRKLAELTGFHYRLQQSLGPLYERTRLLRNHEHWSIPGLLQTAAYSAESNRYWARLLDLPDVDDAATGAGLERQRIMRAPGHRFAFLLSEQVLRTRVGSAEIMIEQLDRLLAVMSMPNVSIGIIPATAGLGAHAQTAFWIFDENLVRVDTLTAELEISRPAEIAVYVMVFSQMQRMAMFSTDAQMLILRARDQFLQ